MAMLACTGISAPSASATTFTKSFTSAGAMVNNPPVLLMFHPGGFTQGSPAPLDSAAQLAREQGFEAVQVSYTLGDVDAAYRDAKRATKQYGNERRIVAFGTSAGGTLAALLAQKGLVDRAGVYAPAAKRRHVKHQPLHDLGLTKREYRKFSPAVHKSKAPIKALVPRDDQVVPPRDTLRGSSVTRNATTAPAARSLIASTRRWRRTGYVYLARRSRPRGGRLRQPTST